MHCTCIFSILGKKKKRTHFFRLQTYQYHPLLYLHRRVIARKLRNFKIWVIWIILNYFELSELFELFWICWITRPNFTPSIYTEIKTRLEIIGVTIIYVYHKQSYSFRVNELHLVQTLNGIIQTLNFHMWNFVITIFTYHIWNNVIVFTLWGSYFFLCRVEKNYIVLENYFFRV